jgi:hypothetical protein
MAQPIITEKEIRIFLLDKPELNTLIKGVKFDSTDIEQAIINVIDYFNVASPPTGQSYTVENFPFRFVLLTGIAGHLLKGAAVNEAINQLDYAVDGVTVQDKNKAGLFTQLGQGFWEEFKQMVRDIKVNQNVSAAFGSMASEYTYRVR